VNTSARAKITRNRLSRLRNMFMAATPVKS
jgi:hypothetical protein